MTWELMLRMREGCCPNTAPEVRGSGRGMGGPPPDQSRLLLPPRQGIGCRKCVAVREFLNIINRFFCNAAGFCGSSCGTPVPSAVLTKK